MSIEYKLISGATGSSAPAKVSTSTSAEKTILQILHASQPLTVVEWGISFDGSSAAEPIVCELIETGAIAATVTAAAGNDLGAFNQQADPNVAAGGGVTLSGAGTGYNATAEGAVVAPVRNGDLQNIAPSNGFLHQYPLNQEFRIPATKVGRIRVNNPSGAVNCYAYMIYFVG
jgi:hypothetical protein